MSTAKAEMSLLQACTIGGRKAIDECAALVSPADFSEPKLSRLFAAMLSPEATDEEGHLDIVAVTQACGAWVDEAWATLNEMNNNAMTSVNADHYARDIRKFSQMRQLAAMCRSAADEMDRAEYSTADPVAAADALIERALDIGQSRNSASARHIREGLKATLAEWKRRYEARDSVLPGFKTGLEQLDGLVTFEPGHVCLIGAASGHGKTALTTHLADAAAEQGCSVLDVTCEVPEVDLLTRLVAGGARIDSRRLSTGIADAEEILRAREAVQQRIGRDLYILDAPTITVPAIEREVRRTIRRPGNTAVGVLIVDYLQLVKPTERHGNREQDVAEVADSLLELAKRQNIVVIVAAQLNRAGAQRSDKRPVSSDLRESSRAEHNATTVLMLYRPALHGEDGASETACEIIVRKNRKGPLGTANVHYDARTNHWGNLTKGRP